MKGIQAELDRSAEASSRELDFVWMRLFGPEGTPKPRTWLERNNDIYARLGYVPRREN